MATRSKHQREADLLKISEMYLRGVYQVKIAEEIGISQAMVSKEIKKLHGRWKVASAENIDARKLVELRKIDELERNYWSAWDESTRTVEVIIDHKTYLMPMKNNRRNPLGNPKYLDGVQWCIAKRCKLLGVDLPEPEESDKNEMVFLPAYAIARSFVDVYRDMAAGNHTEYVFRGGRGSTKSTFVSLSIIEQLINNPDRHALAIRKVKDTLRDSVYAQLVWSINFLGLNDKFKLTKSPLEITYIPTGQKIYFRGADDPMKIKSIKPPFGYIGILWFEELDQYAGDEEIRSIMQSAIRGGDFALIFKSLNPPRTRNNWTFKSLQIPKENRYLHDSNYLSVPPEWLGKIFIEEAEFLKEVNYPAYEHEYLGVANAIGGLIFQNVTLRPITEKEIEEFDRPLHGLDWGYFPDPADYVDLHYQANTMTLYIYGEVRRWRYGNKALYDAIIEHGYNNFETVICDSSEPKSIADMRTYGMAARGAQKGPESVKYSMKWLQSLREIVIDNERAPDAATEFLNYEHEMDKEGNYVSEYPDKDNHAIDATRYGTNMIWKRKGK